MTEQSKEGGRAESADLQFARKQLANLQAQLPRVRDTEYYEQVAKRVSQLMQVIASLETEEDAYQPTHSHARSNGLVFAQNEVRPTVSMNADTRPSGAPIRFSHRDPSGQAPMPQAQPHNPNPPATPMQFSHDDGIDGQAYKKVTQ